MYLRIMIKNSKDKIVIVCALIHISKIAFFDEQTQKNAK